MRNARWMLIALAMLALAAPADASTISRSGAVIVYEAAPGEVNVLSVSLTDGGIAVQEGTVGVTLTAGPGCAPDPDNPVVTCAADGVTAVVIRLGDGNDEAFKPGRPPVPPSYQYRVEGGPGKDDIAGTPRVDLLSGGSGADLISGEGGRDRIGGGAGNDHINGQGTIDGGAGNDFIDLVLPEGLKPVGSKVFGGSGNDGVISRNGVRDIIDCGKGRKDRATVTDNAFGRKLDRITQGCESRSGR